MITHQKYHNIYRSLSTLLNAKRKYWGVFSKLFNSVDIYRANKIAHAWNQLPVEYMYSESTQNCGTFDFPFAQPITKVDSAEAISRGI